MPHRHVVVIGAGPAGLSAALELVTAGCQVTVLEQDPDYVGGLARTVEFGGSRFDIGAHRFYTKNPEIAAWWHARLPNDFIRIKRLTRILFQGRLFRYPLQVGDAVRGLGPLESLKCLGSCFARRILPIRPECSFEDWVSNRFGDRIYRTFFKTYTEKVWGQPCSQISADWASQRIKGLSLISSLKATMGWTRPSSPVIKTLIDEFHYPRFGAGMMWERTRDEILQRGGRILLGKSVVALKRVGNLISEVVTLSPRGQVEHWPAEAVIASMPLRDCILGITPRVDPDVEAAARSLRYRDFILVALIVRRENLFPDNWIYVHDPTVNVGRIENYNNWGPSMRGEAGTSSLGLEYFCSRGDELWALCNDDIADLAKRELERLSLARADEITAVRVVRVEKAYPIYDHGYRANLDVIRGALRVINNLHVVGRNGMHKYNNQDHSMLTGILAARNLFGSDFNLWQVNGDAEYLEEESADDLTGRATPMPRQHSPS